MQNILSFINEFFADNSKKEVLATVLKKTREQDLLLVEDLNNKMSQLTYDDKLLISATMNDLTIRQDTANPGEMKERDSLIRFLSIFTNMLLNSNPLQKDRIKGLLKELNGKQQLSAIVKDGPLLLTAGPGSGKTRTLTYKIALLINGYGVHPGNILAVTFTNKAAGEMKERIKKLVGKDADKINMGTFHSVCTKFLRTNIDALNSAYYNNKFTIIEGSAQDKKLKEILKELGYDPKLLRDVKGIISDYKNKLKTPEDLVNSMQMYEYVDVYEKYQKMLETSNNFDFDDLIMKSVQVLESNTEIREKFQNIYKYIHVDEYQDTNPAQYKLTRLLAEKHRNICVVGDEDQSIYKFRGADITNILNFIKDYPEALAIALDTNYRSTKTIVEASSSLILKNKERLDKVIKPFAGKDQGDAITVSQFYDDKQEASFISQKIRERMREQDFKYNDFMVLYRNNYLSRAVEESFIRTGIPYNIVGGTGFYDREEILDLLAYMKLSINLQDSLSFERIYNTPKRKISVDVLNTIKAFADEYSMSYFQASLQIIKINKAHYTNQDVPAKYHKYILTAAQFKALLEFSKLVKAMYDKSQNSTAYEALSYILEATNYKNYIRNAYSKDLNKQLSKLGNIDEFLHASVDYTENFEVEEDTPQEFLSFVSLIKDNNVGNIDFDEIETLNDNTFNMKRDDRGITFFGQYAEQRSGIYEFHISTTVLKEVSKKMTSILESSLKGESVDTSISHVYLNGTPNEFTFKFQEEYEFVFTLEQASIVVKYIQSVAESQSVRLMTMHAAKGLECPVVFIIGVEQGITPHFLNIEANLEEERRLFYVGLTRAEQEAYLSHCQFRYINGQSQYPSRSQFVKEIPDQFLFFNETK